MNRGSTRDWTRSWIDTSKLRTVAVKRKKKDEGNGLRGGGRRPTIRGKRLFDVASWTLAFGARSVPNFILFPAQPFVKHRRAAGKEFSPLGSSFVVQRTRRGDTPDGSIARVDFCEGKTLFPILLLYLVPVSTFFFFPSHRSHPCSPEESGNENVSILRDERIYVLIPWRGKPPSIPNCFLWKFYLHFPLSFNRG